MSLFGLTVIQEATWVIEHFRELLELVVIYLGTVAKRVQKGEIVPVNPTTIRKTGAVQRERFMASSL